MLNMINTYAPNDPKEKEEFFKDLKKKIKKDDWGPSAY